MISPIGKVGSDIRNYADLIFEFIIKPVVERHSYSPVRADHIYEPGMITTDIINRLSEVDLVVADLTTTNFNVAYELAIRHSVRKPVIQISHSYGAGRPKVLADHLRSPTLAFSLVVYLIGKVFLSYY